MAATSLTTPLTSEDLDHARAFLEKEGEWNLTSTNGNTKMYSNKQGVIKVVGTELAIPFEELVEMFSHFPNKKIMSAKTIGEARYVEEPTMVVKKGEKPGSGIVQEGYDLTYSAAISPNSWIVSHRDFISRRRFRETEDGTFTIVEKEGVHESIKPTREGHVRAKIRYGATHFSRCKKNPNTHIDYSIISDVDVGGWIPEGMVSMAMKQTIEELKKGYEAYKKSKQQVKP